MHDIYVVVAETGEYRTYDRTIICYFTEEDEAKKYAKAKKAVCNNERLNFKVEKIEHGTPFEDADSILDEAQKRKEEEDRLNRQKEVNAFLVWWNNGPTNDPYFNDKISSKCRSIKNLLYQYAEETKDSRALTWLACNSQFFL